MSPSGHRALRVGGISRSMVRWSFILVALTIVLLGVLPRSASGLEFKYHSHAQIAKTFRKFMKRYPDITRVLSLGKSNEGNELLVISIGKYAKNPGLLIPNVKYIANMHGNEVVGREMLLHLADHFLKSYSSNQTIQEFLNKTTVHLMPTMNPDGFAVSNVGDCMSIKGRGNYNYKDLNRNFPDPYLDQQEPSQVETMLVRRWVDKVPFVLSANLHGGAEVVNYPWDSLNGDMSRAVYAASPDDDVFKHLSLTFSRSHHTMHQGAACGDYFEDGITNGANWYPVKGSMADYMYRNGHGYELLIEMTCCKYPDPSTLPGFWNKNKDAMINLLFAVHMGVKGIVTSDGDPGQTVVLSGAKVAIVGREEIVTKTSKAGEFYRLLLPGDYFLTVSYDGYITRTVPFTVYGHDNVTILTVRLTPIIIPQTGSIPISTTAAATPNNGGHKIDIAMVPRVDDANAATTTTTTTVTTVTTTTTPTPTALTPKPDSMADPDRTSTNYSSLESMPPRKEPVTDSPTTGEEEGNEEEGDEEEGNEEEGDEEKRLQTTMLPTMTSSQDPQGQSSDTHNMGEMSKTKRPLIVTRRPSFLPDHESIPGNDTQRFPGDALDADSHEEGDTLNPNEVTPPPNTPGTISTPPTSDDNGNDKFKLPHLQGPIGLQPPNSQDSSQGTSPQMTTETTPSNKLHIAPSIRPNSHGRYNNTRVDPGNPNPELETEARPSRGPESFSGSTQTDSGTSHNNLTGVPANNSSQNQLDRHFSSSGASASRRTPAITDSCLGIFQTVARLSYTFLLIASSSILSH